jgi:hypothetical protein
MQEMCCTEKRSAQKISVAERKRSSGKRTSGSFKAAHRFSNFEWVISKDSPLSLSESQEAKIEGHPSLDKKPNTSSSDLSMDAEHATTIPQSGSWRGSNSSFRSSGKGAAMFQNSCDWPSAEQRSLESAVEMAAAYMKLKPPGFFVIQVGRSLDWERAFILFRDF